MSEISQYSVLLGVVYIGLRLATPYLYAAIGELFAECSGIVNLGIEGIMLMGAYVAFYVATESGSLEIGLLAGALTGLVLGLVMAVMTVTFRAVQAIAGLGMGMFGLGLSSLLFLKTMNFGQSIAGFPPLKIPLLGDLPVVGQVLFNHNVLVYVAFLLVPMAAWVLNHTTMGLKIRAVGQNPAAADSVGVNVTRIRYGTTCFAGMMGGIAGASLSIAVLNLFQENMTNGMGFIALALVVFGGWSPWGVLAGALLFSSVNAFQLWIQVENVGVPPEFAAMLPYILTLVVLAMGGRRVRRQPAALAKPFLRGEN